MVEGGGRDGRQWREREKRRDRSEGEGGRKGRPHRHIFLLPILLVLPHTLGPSSQGGIKKHKGEGEEKEKRKGETIKTTQ